MCLLVSAFAGRDQKPKTQKYSVLLADTVIVGEKFADVVTSKCTKAVKMWHTHSMRMIRKKIGQKSSLNVEGVRPPCLGNTQIYGSVLLLVVVRRKLTGSLEAHTNGLRYSTSRPDERVDVIQPQFKALDLEFDQPVRELGFHGVPHKVSAFIVPTSSCLVELIETPCVVITLSEIEIVNLERVGLGQKNFDMTVVFKDFKRDVLRIDSIPSTSLDGIKEWLNTTDLKYYEISDSDSENSADSDQGYMPSDVQSDSGSDDEDDLNSEEERKRRKIKAFGKAREPARAPTRPPARPPARAPTRPPARPPARAPARPPSSASNPTT
ncbi:hypothetical protein POTOM_043659 [Populus tomentosa]|uniref:FACT complex subunit n=1 Tax=Populus tomentosa TaxID=118781 RepID=A0A8X7YK42_POPTO|nr:hypothetical protein POTOM_043659 [Populus tomentosa]